MVAALPGFLRYGFNSGMVLSHLLQLFETDVFFFRHSTFAMGNHVFPRNPEREIPGKPCVSKIPLCSPKTCVVLFLELTLEKLEFSKGFFMFWPPGRPGYDPHQGKEGERHGFGCVFVGYFFAGLHQGKSALNYHLCKYYFPSKRF